jgi:excisionase family DNA binding protein
MAIVKSAGSLRPKDVAAQLGINVATVLKLIEIGKLSAIDVSTGRRKPTWVITRAAFDEFVAARNRRAS